MVICMDEVCSCGIRLVEGTKVTIISGKKKDSGNTTTTTQNGIRACGKMASNTEKGRCIKTGISYSQADGTMGNNSERLQVLPKFPNHHC